MGIRETPDKIGRVGTSERCVPRELAPVLNKLFVL